MVDAEKVVAYIRDCFEEFELNYQEFFSYYDEESDELVECELIREDGSVDPAAVKLASEVLGIREKDIYAAREKAVMKKIKQFPYLEHHRLYEYARKRSFYDGEAYDDIRILEVLFGQDIDKSGIQRYNYQSIKGRMIEQLKNIDKVMPGTYHKRAEINDLSIAATNIVHYDGIVDMVGEIIRMFNRAGELFFRALKSDLEEVEINEYNFIVSLLRIRDAYYHSGYIYYSNICRCREVYIQEARPRFQDYVRVDNYRSFKPWICTGFIENRNLVEEYLDIMPEAKGLMREDAMSISNFCCTFTWSDAHPIMLSPEEEEELLWCGFADPIPLDERALEPTTIYVPKTEEELDGDDYFVSQLSMLAKSKKHGGVAVRTPKSMFSNNLQDFQRRIGLIQPNGFYERQLQASRNAGGEDSV